MNSKNITQLQRTALSFLALALSLLIGKSLAWAQIEFNPQKNWLQLETDHFYLVYNAEHQQQANLYAQKLEQSHFLLKKRLSLHPQKTWVVLNDRTDLTNGYANRIPYPHIVLYPVTPGPDDSLSDIGDWMLGLTLHELTHIATFEPPSTPVINSLRSVFGNIISPNLLLPRWWTEGLAVEFETSLTSHGRLRSSYQDSALRAMVSKKTLRQNDIALANENTPFWPEGSRPYLFGSLIWSQIQADSQNLGADQLIHSHGSQIPYFINDRLTPVTGLTYEAEYNKSLSTVEEKALGQIEVLQKISPSPIRLFKNNGLYQTKPSISPNGMSLVFVEKDSSGKRSIKLVQKKDPGQSFTDLPAKSLLTSANDSQILNQFHETSPTGLIGRMAWLPDSQGFIFDKVEYQNPYEQRSDLHWFDIKANKAEPLTKNLRAREPAISPSGKKVAFIKINGAELSLCELLRPEAPLSQKLTVPLKIDCHWTAPLNHRISSPAYLNEEQILFSWRDSEGHEKIFSLNLGNQSVEAFIVDPGARFPRMTSEGLLWTSLASGVNNVYLKNQTHSAAPITHLLTGAFDADLDAANGELVFTVMTENGPQLAALAKDSSYYLNSKEPLPSIQRLLEKQYPNNPDAPFKYLGSIKNSTYEYNGTLWPQYWIPFIAGSSTSGGLLFQAQTAAFDPLKHHTYSLGTSFDTGSQQLSYQASYLNQQTTLPWAVVASQFNTFLGNIENRISDTFVDASIIPNLFNYQKYSGLQIGFSYLGRTSFGNEVKRLGPRIFYTYTTSAKFGQQISPESGFNGYLGYQNFMKVENSIAHNRITAGARYYWSKFLPERHAIALKTNILYTPERLSAVLGASNDSFALQYDSGQPEYLLRGYLRGQIFGKNMIATNIEYRFPIRDLFLGDGTRPLFIRRIYGAVINDNLAADGFYLNAEKGAYEAVKTRRIFSTVGIEARIEGTLGYSFPGAFIVGLYSAPQSQNQENIFLGTTLQLGIF